MNNNYYWSLIAASKKKLPPIWVEYIVARAGDFSLPTYDTMQENIVTDTDHLASVQLYDSNKELTANLRPCLSTEKGHYLEGCLYDVVKKKFYYSQNAGVNYGDIVREVEYIQNTGTQCIDSGIIPTFTMCMNISIQIVDLSHNIVFFTRWTNNPTYDTYGFYVSSTSTLCVCYYGRYNLGKYQSSVNTFRSGSIINVYIDVNNLKINNESYFISRENVGFDNATNIIMFNNSLGTAKLFYLTLSDNKKNVFDGMPCILSDGTVCMWDWISGKAKKNAGTGEFVAGKDMNDLFNIVEKEGVFLNRTTGEGLNVKDKSLAHITSLKGNTLIFNQLLKDGKIIDMGLPSGTLWATCDIDVTNPDGFANTPFTYEKSFFSWGNIDGHNPISTSAFSYNWGNVNAAEPWYDGQVYGGTKGNTLTGNIPVGEEFDAARANLGTMWRIPLSTDFYELIDNCIYIDADGNEVDTSKVNKCVTVNGVVGLYLQSKSNGNRLFFSASGYGYGSSWNNRGANGNYWSRSFYSARNARRMSFGSSRVYPQYDGYRCNGFAVRAVIKPSNIITTGSNNHKYYMKNNKNIFDLTKMFGAGNEPETAEEFEAMFPANYYDYDAGSLLNVDAGGIKSFDVGKTKWDSLYFLDDTHTLSSLTGKAEGSSVSEVVFPEGMKRIGDVYDELTDVKNGCFTKAVKRVGSVDLGSLVWRYYGGGWNCFLVNIINKANGVDNLISPIYLKSSVYNSSLDKIYCGNMNNNTIYFKDTSFGSDNVSFKAAMDGIMLNYELTTPIIYTLDTPIPCNYKVWKSGSEIVVPENTEVLTAPMDMSVKYIVEEDE